jgi:uncharacterized protein (UPF0333 family)
MEFSTLVIVVLVAAIGYVLYKTFSKKESVVETAPYKVEEPVVESAPVEAKKAPAVKKAPAAKKPAVKKATTRKPKAK